MKDSGVVQQNLTNTYKDFIHCFQYLNTLIFMLLLEIMILDFIMVL